MKTSPGLWEGPGGGCGTRPSRTTAAGAGGRGGPWSQTRFDSSSPSQSPGLFEKISIEECIDEEAYEVMRTLGQAVDEAVAAHEAAYPGSSVYSADVNEARRVEVRASHFSVPLVYEVDANRCASEECLALQRAVEARAAECRALVQAQLLPASTSSKRQAATARVLQALAALEEANAELFEGLADVEDAV